MSVRSQTSKLEAAASKRESEIISGNTVTMESIDAVKDVDHAILTAIRAKLKVLNFVSQGN